VTRALRLVLLLALAATPAAAQRSLAIERFQATIRVNRDASIDVTEVITARFTGSWNGIYRKIPVVYRNAQGFNWTLGLDVRGAVGDDGRALRVETSRDRHYVQVKMWVPGAQDATRTVTLRYHATNGLRFFEEHDELYWNVTGDEWDVPIGAAGALIELPPDAAGVRATSFNGVYGSRAQEARVETRGTSVTAVMPHALGFREGLTVVVGWNKGVVTPPSALAGAARFVTSNWPLVLPIPVFFIAFAIWRRRGKDPHSRPIAVQYKPPEGLTPGEAGTLLDHSVDMRDITATLVHLAVRGHLRFEEQDERKLFGLIGSREYVLHKLETPADDPALAEHERLVMDGVFGGRGSAVKLSDLEDEFYSSIPAIKNSIFERLLDRRMYHARPDHVRARWLVAAVVLGLVIGVGGNALAGRFLMTPVPFFAAAVLCGAIVFAFGLVMPARSEAGARMLEQVIGFQEFLTRVEAEHLKRVIIGHPEMFDQYLAYAMAFGVEKKWAKAFEGIYTEPPRWYVGSHMTAFSVGHLSSSLSTFSSQVSATMQSSPRSSSGSGFGGGGSSGGGGGGGGGGGF
jgi:uncharacterized membrane protein YgcG